MTKNRAELRSDLLVWIDLELTSILDPAVDRIVEIVAVLTDHELNVVAQMEPIVIHAERELFDRIPHVRDMHAASGLIEESVASRMTEAEAEKKVLEFLEVHVVKQSSPLCGSSIYMDRMFLKARMPELESYMHYRLIDVSTVKELTRRWYPHVYGYIQEMKCKKAHRSLGDILDSINELKVYKQAFFHEVHLP